MPIPVSPMIVEERMRSLLLLIVLTWACDGGDRPDGVLGTRYEVGDTTVVVFSGAPSVIEPAGLETFWQSSELQEPRALAYSDGSLLVGDPTRIHLLGVPAVEAKTIGREGAGPGEFQSIVGVGFGGDETLIVLDGALDRLSRFTLSGDFLHSSRVSVGRPFLNPRINEQGLVLWDGGLLMMRGGFSRSDRIPRVALIWHDLDADTATVVETWADIERERQGDFVVSPEAFPARPIIAVGTGGMLAAGDGLEYCFTLSSIQDHTVTRVCRDWNRAEVTQAIRSPDVDAVTDPIQRDLVRKVTEFQDPGEFLPSFDVLRFGERGEIWVRTMGSETSHVHPMILSRRPDLGPSHRLWDVFDQQGQLRVTVRFPSEFDPRVMMSDRVFGFLELETGEIVVGEAVFVGGIFEDGNGR